MPSCEVGVIDSQLPLPRITVAPLHYCTTALLHYCTTARFSYRRHLATRAIRQTIVAQNKAFAYNSTCELTIRILYAPSASLIKIFCVIFSSLSAPIGLSA
jgi:hypothetical protein